jgi:hypothetical protein
LGILEWAHRRETPLQRRAWAMLKIGSAVNSPVVPGVHQALMAERRFRKGPLRLLWNKIYHEPLFRLQCDSIGNGLLLLEGMPKIIGNLRITIGTCVHLYGEQVWIAAGDGSPKTLEIGDESGIGFGTEFIVGTAIKVGRHVKIANRVSFIGYDGHPLDPFARARHEPPGTEGISSITVNDYAWVHHHEGCYDRSGRRRRDGFRRQDERARASSCIGQSGQGSPANSSTRRMVEKPASRRDLCPQ